MIDPKDYFSFCSKIEKQSEINAVQPKQGQTKVVYLADYKKQHKPAKLLTNYGLVE